MQRSAGKRKSEGGQSDEAPERNGEEEEDEVEAEAEAMEDQFEAALAARGGGGGDTWQVGGARKDVVIRILVQCFASMVESLPREDAIPDFKGRYRSEDLVHVKLLDANKQVVKAKKTLLKHENFATRDFTIFIAQKHWVPNILRPLLELCAKDDTNLAMNCAGLALVLVRRMSDKTLQLLQESKEKKQKRKRITEKPESKEGKNPPSAENEEEKKKSAVLSDSEEEENDEEDEHVSQAVVDNARQQLSVLLSFKEGLCSDKCNEAITNAFREFWSAEQVSSSEDTKLGVAICLSYFRRILAIGPDPVWSSPGEILKQRDVHHQYIVQLSALLSVIPGICSDLRRSYHDDWLVDVIHIIYHILQSYDAEDMFLVWKENGIIDQFSSLYSPSEEEEEGTENSASPASAALPIAVPTALKDKYSQKTLSKGLLSSKLQAERSARSQIISRQAVQNRFNRSSATYKQNIYIPQQPELFSRNTSTGNGVRSEDLYEPIPDSSAAYERNQQMRAQSAAGGEEEAKDGEAGPADSIFLRTVFGQPSDSIPQAKARRNRRNITFVKGNPYLGSKAAQGQTLFAQQATVIAASFLEVFSQEACFKTFVRRVNEDLRRDERRISQDVEMEYFHILFKVLQYNRLKLQHSHRLSSQSGEKWQPSFKNIIDTLDKMSFTRVIVTLEKLFLQSLKQSKNHLLHSMKRFITQSQVIFPLQLYAEMIAYLRLMLRSDNLTYYEIAIGALYRLYYVTNSSKLDVLVRLFNNYKNNIYTKDYLDALIICAHETFQVLETARTVFVQQKRDSVIYQKYHHVLENFLHKKSLKGLSKKDLDMEVYILSCYKFDIYDYFKKMMTPHTVDLYMKVLANVEENSPSINDYILHFMQRCYDFKIEKDGFYADSMSNNSSSADTAPRVNLSYLFFNLSSLSIIYSLLTNINVQTNAKYGELLLFLRRVVRDFALLAQKNHLLLVEALLNNITNMDVCHNIFTVYDARLIIGGQEGNAETSLRHSSSEMPFNKGNSSDDELGDEFDEEDLPKAFTDRPEQEKKSKNSTLRRNKNKTKKKSTNEESDDDISINDSSTDSAGDSEKEDKSGDKGQEDENDQSDAEGLGKESDNDDQVVKRAKRTSAAGNTKRYRWSAEEDATLERLFSLYASSRSLYASIAEHEDMEAFGTNRTSQQVAARIRFLGLREKSKSSSGSTKTTESSIHHPSRSPSHLDAVVEKAAWDVDEEGAIFEQRSRALEAFSQRMTASEEEAEEESTFPQDNSSRSKELKSSASSRTSKTSRTKALKKLSKSSNRELLSENEESAGEMDLVDDDSQAETLPQTSAPLSAPGTSTLAKMLESDDEDL